MALHADDRDPTVAPGEDFYRYANGGWLDANPIPAGYGSWGAFHEVDERNLEILQSLLERAAEEPADDLDRLLGDYYHAGMDTAAIEAAGLEPLQGYLDSIRAISSHADVTALLKDGSKVHVFVKHAIGSLQNPMTDTMLEAKFHGLSDNVLGKAQVDELLKACWGLGNSANVDALIKLATPV